ncbi:MAG: efflux transporter outer membrane subunit [Hyphomicrobiales bacterium]|nr:efflux transporter outer membrane subunit [Hyphomicrobiales bacterium]
MPSTRKVRSATLNRMRHTCGGVLISVSMILLGSGCMSVGPDYEPPETVVPDLWTQDLRRGLNTNESDLQSWWTRFNDPLLQELIQESSAGNLGLRDALARLVEARARTGIASGEQLPSIDASGDIERGRLSRGVADGVDNSRQRTSTLYQLGMDATWEIDLWGRISRSVESADATYQASLEDYRDALISLYADVALAYTDIRTFQARISAALGNVETQRKTLRLVRDRRASGLASDLEVAQAELNLARTESLVPALRSGLKQSIHRLSVLIGRPPSTLYSRFVTVEPIPAPPSSIAVGAPAEVLRQRPDIRSAERALAAQTAQIGVATADLYPRFTLSGFFAFQKFGVTDLLNSKNLGYGFGPTMIWNVFDGGRIRSNIKVQDALTEQSLLNYEQTVLTALQEVEDAMVGFVQESERRDTLARSVGAAQRSVDLVQTLYVTGLTDFQNVQDQERSLFEQQDALEASKGLVTTNLINLYQALGGGWSPLRDDQKTATTNGPPPIKAETVSSQTHAADS